MPRRTISLPAALVLFALIAPTVPAQAVVFSNFGVGDTYNISGAAGVFGSGSGVGQTIRRAASFIPATTTLLVDAQVPLSSSTPTPDIRLSIIEDNAGSPTGATVQISGLSGITTRNIYTFTFTGNQTLVAGTRYWIVMEPLNPNGTLSLSWHYNTTGNQGYQSRFGTGAWQEPVPNTVPTMAYRINGTAVVVPEAGTLALVGAGLAAFGAVVVRRRK